MKILPLDSLHQAPEDITDTLTNNKDQTILLEQDGKSQIVMLSAANYAKLLAMSAACNCPPNYSVSDAEYSRSAMSIFIEQGSASPATLQRRLRIGYGKASQIMTVLEGLGAIGPKGGNKPREVLVKDLSEFDHLTEDIVKVTSHPAAAK